MSTTAITSPDAVTIGDQTWAPTKKSRVTYIPFVCDMVGTVTTAAEDARTTLTRAKIYPGDSTDVLGLIAAIEEWAEAHQMTDLIDLSGDTAAQLICDLAGVNSLQDLRRGYIPTQDAMGQLVDLAEWESIAQQRRAAANRILYTLILMRGSTILLRRHRWRGARQLDDSLADGLPLLLKAGPEGRKSRPLTDEEIMLCRLLLEIDIAEKAPPRPSITYLMAENGIRGIESTSLDTTHLYPPIRPTEVKAPGAWEFGGRTVDLTSYSASVLPKLLAKLYAGTQQLTYTGMAPGQLSATSSITGVLMRHIRRAGIRDEMVTPKSINFWRPMHALLTTSDIVAARRYHGAATVNLLTDLRLIADERHVGTHRQVQLRRKGDNSFVANVLVADYNDQSMTRRVGRKKARKKRAKAERRREAERQQEQRHAAKAKC